MLVDRPPQVAQRAVDLHEHLIEVPLVAGAWAPAAQLVSAGRTLTAFAGSLCFMPGQQGLVEQEAVERALGSRFPWLPESRVHKVSEILITRMAELGVDHYDTFTPELMMNAQRVGEELGQMIGSAPPIPRNTYRGNLKRMARGIAWDIVCRLGGRVRTVRGG